MVAMFNVVSVLEIHVSKISKSRQYNKKNKKKSSFNATFCSIYSIKCKYHYFYMKVTKRSHIIIKMCVGYCFYFE